MLSESETLHSDGCNLRASRTQAKSFDSKNTPESLVSSSFPHCTAPEEDQSTYYETIRQVHAA